MCYLIEGKREENGKVHEKNEKKAAVRGSCCVLAGGVAAGGHGHRAGSVSGVADSGAWHPAGAFAAAGITQQGQSRVCVTGGGSKKLVMIFDDFMVVCNGCYRLRTEF